MQVRFQMHEESSNAIARTPPYSCDCSYIRWNSALFIDVARAESAAAQSGQERQRSLQKRAGTKGRSLRSTASHYAIHYILARGAMRVLSLRKCIRQGRQEAEAAEQPVTPDLPRADEIVQEYIAAIGGSSTIGKLQSVTESGTFHAGPRQFPVEVLKKSPDHVATV